MPSRGPNSFSVVAIAIAKYDIIGHILNYSDTVLSTFHFVKIIYCASEFASITLSKKQEIRILYTLMTSHTE